MVEPQSSEARPADATGDVFNTADRYSVTDLDRTHEYAVLIGVVAASSDDRSSAGFILRLHPPTGCDDEGDVVRLVNPLLHRQGCVFPEMAV
jgi:hypothetical protein